MALPLDPQTQDEMFPDTLVDPFVLSEEVAELAGSVVAKWDEFRALAEAIDSDVNPLAIAYVLDTKKFDIAEDWSIHTVVNVTKASPLWRSLSNYGVVVAYRQVFWDAHDEDERRAFLHHGLSHIETLGPKVTLRAHPAEGFPWTFRRYGPLSAGEQMFVKAGSLWAEDHPQEPTPLRAVPVEEAARKFREGIEQGDVDVTVTHGDRSVTIEGKGRRRASVTPDDRAGDLVCVGSNHVPGCEHLQPPAVH